MATNCNICFDEITDYKNSLYTTKCNHTFCQKCIVTWLFLHNNCPTCRTNLIDNKDINDDDVDDVHYIDIYIEIPNDINIPENIVDEFEYRVKNLIESDYEDEQLEYHWTANNYSLVNRISKKGNITYIANVNISEAIPKNLFRSLTDATFCVA